MFLDLCWQLSNFFFSKIFEKLLLDQLQRHFNKYKLLNSIKFRFFYCNSVYRCRATYTHFWSMGKLAGCLGYFHILSQTFDSVSLMRNASVQCPVTSGVISWPMIIHWSGNYTTALDRLIWIAGSSLDPAIQCVWDVKKISGFCCHYGSYVSCN